MIFLAQIDCEVLPPIGAEWPVPDPPLPCALVRCFANLLDEPGGACAAAVIVAAAGGSYTRVSRPDDPGYEDDDEQLVELPEAAVTLAPFLSLPAVLAGVCEGMEDYSETADDYRRLGWELRTALQPAAVRKRRPGARRPHHILGEAFSIQDDVRYTGMHAAGSEWTANLLGLEVDPTLAEREAWRTLLALHGDPEVGLAFGDGGALHLLIPVIDLRSGRFDRIICNADSC